jgi:hypothetical protein
MLKNLVTKLDVDWEFLLHIFSHHDIIREHQDIIREIREVFLVRLGTLMSSGRKYGSSLLVTQLALLW